jgi:hypothetical protein
MPIVMRKWHQSSPRLPRCRCTGACLLSAALDDMLVIDSTHV